MTTFHLCQKYPDTKITWIYPENNKTIGVGEALVPAVSNFFKNVGLTHQDIIKHCNGTLKLGIKFEDFNEIGQSFTFPFGIGETERYNTSSVERIMHTELIPENIYDYPDIATHCRTTETLSYLDTKVSQFSNLTIQRKTVSLEELSGSYDLLIDSTGFSRQISGRPDNFKSIKHLIPNNKALAYRHPYTDKTSQLKPYSTFKAMSHGWIWNIPLGDQLAMGYVHDDKFDVKQEFIEYIESKMKTTINPNDIVEVPMVTGRNIIHLKDNIVPIGLSSAFIEPLESTGLYLITTQLEKLCNYIDGVINENEYNEGVNDSFDKVVNFIAAHYKYSKRRNEYWDYYKNVEVENFKTMDIFPHEAWQYVLGGFDIGVERPKDTINTREFISIQKGKSYTEWLNDERNIT